MPWCASCSRFLSPPSVRADGTCPQCGASVDPGRGRAVVDTRREHADEPARPLPWHLKLLAGAVAVYLGYRAWQGIDWVIHRF